MHDGVESTDGLFEIGDKGALIFLPSLVARRAGSKASKADRFGAR
jgi:hypothetical protein